LDKAVSSTEEHSRHIVPLRTYLAVAAALLLLTAITVTVSYVPLGGYNVLVALTIAAFKASLVALFFMHLKYDRKIYLVIFVIAVTFLAVFIVFTMFDTLHRDDIYEITDGPIEENAIIYDKPVSDSTAPGSKSAPD
jgi:cytochrome c oxidase subunit 4